MPGMRVLLLVLLLLGGLRSGVCVGASNVPVFDASAMGDQLTLSRGWLFHAGDDPGFASPGLDDKAWTRVELQKTLDTYGVPADTRFGWLRLHVHLPPKAVGQGAFAPVIGVYRSLGRYQIFANGHLLGTVGDMDRHDLEDRAFITQFPIPPGALEGGSEVVIALRFSLQTVTYGSVPPEAPFLVGEVLLGSNRSLKQDNTARTVLQTAPIAINIVPSLLIGLVALALFVTLRAHREYLLLAMFCFFNAASSLGEFLSWLLPFTVTQILVGSLIQLPLYLSLFGFIGALLPARRMRLFGFLTIAAIIDCSGPVLWSAGFISYLTADVTQLLDPVIYGVLCGMLVQAYRRGNPSLRYDLRILLPGLFLLTAPGLNTFVVLLVAILQARHVVVAEVFRHFSNHLKVGPFLLQYWNLGSLAFELSILVFLVGRTVRLARERNRVAAEIEAAQTVQYLLLARSAGTTPGFAVETVYRPASEVGGDFFLVSPDAGDGSLVAIVGDVSGKGLTAAMRVAMILGMLRRESSRAPEEILARLNEALITDGEVGFTTACCVHLRRTGEYVVANAGHLSPYVQGVETATVPGLPLGLAGEQTYDVVAGALGAGERMVLVSDGVPEARAATGELYGFERLAKLTLRPAGEIADVAQRFGQEDDITVLSIVCLA